MLNLLCRSNDSTGVKRILEIDSRSRRPERAIDSPRSDDDTSKLRRFGYMLVADPDDVLALYPYPYPYPYGYLNSARPAVGRNCPTAERRDLGAASGRWRTRRAPTRGWRGLRPEFDYVAACSFSAAQQLRFNLLGIILGCTITV